MWLFDLLGPGLEGEVMVHSTKTSTALVVHRASSFDANDSHVEDESYSVIDQQQQRRI